MTTKSLGALLSLVAAVGRDQAPADLVDQLVGNLQMRVRKWHSIPLAELAQLIQAFGAVVPDHQRTPWLLEKSIANVSAVLKHDGANFPDFLAAVAAL